MFDAVLKPDNKRFLEREVANHADPLWNILKIKQHDNPNR
jgi:hypothetical protein